MYNSVNSHIGCCADGETYCPLYTTCFDSSQSARISTDDGFTLWWYVSGASWRRPPSWGTSSY